MLVVDASVVVRACASNGLELLGDSDLHAPALMWSEGRSAVRRALWLGEIDRKRADAVHMAVERCAVELHPGNEIGEEAWRLAAEFGWAKTYDAEYVALARMLGCRLVTLDGGLRRGTDRLGFVVTPAELVEPD